MDAKIKQWHIDEIAPLKTKKCARCKKELLIECFSSKQNKCRNCLRLSRKKRYRQERDGEGPSEGSL